MTKQQIRSLLLAKIHLLLRDTGGLSVMVRVPKLGARSTVPTYICQCTLRPGRSARKFVLRALAGTGVPASAEEITIQEIQEFQLLKFTLRLVGTSFSGGVQ